MKVWLPKVGESVFAGAADCTCCFIRLKSISGLVTKAEQRAREREAKMHRLNTSLIWPCQIKSESRRMGISGDFYVV